MPVTTDHASFAARRSLQEIVFSHFGPLDELKYSPPYWRPGALIKDVAGCLRVGDTITVDILKQSTQTGAYTTLQQITWPASSLTAFFGAVLMEPLTRHEQLVLYLSDLGGGSAEDLSMTLTFQQ